MASPRVFTREATGLVRAVSMWEAFFFNNWTAGGAWSSLLWISVYPIWFPNADIIGALAITAIFATFIGAVYALALVAMPRSGCDYVFVSRTLPPAIGLAFSLNLVFWLLIINAWNVYVPFAFMSQTIFSVGAMIGSPGMISSWSAVLANPAYVVVLGIIIYMVANLLVIFGMRKYMHGFQRVLNVVCLVAFVLIVYYFTVYSNADFIVRFNTYMSQTSGSADPYHDIIKLATSLGWVRSSGFDWNQTMAVAVLWWFITTWPMASAWIGGEVKQASNVKIQMVSMIGGSWFTLALAGLFSFFWFRVFSREWLEALGYIVNNYPNQIPAWLSAASPYWGAAWVNFLVGNVPVALIISLAWFLQGIAVITPLVIAASRHLFAWSFDRIVPSKLCEVSEHFSSPIPAVAIAGIVSIAGFIFTAYTTWINFAVAGPLGDVLSLIIMSVAAIVFIWKRKDIYELSPISKLKLAGIPVLPLVGLGSLVSLLIMVGYYFGPINGLALGGVAVPVTGISFGLFGVGIVGFYVAKYVRAKSGLDVTQAFAVIPPE
ncbi:MAG: hypothetical protein ACLPY5_14595 [Candidatus Bathyarchaeia archaeon]